MVSKREKKIAVATAIVIVILALDRFLLTPYLDRTDRLNSELQNMAIERQKNRELLSRWREISPAWEEMLRKEPEIHGAPGGSTLTTIRDWAEESNMPLTLLKPEGTAMHGELEERIFLVVGTGSMRNISRFIWQIESSELPLKIKDMQMAARKEGTDDLSVQVRIGELYLPRPAIGAQALDKS